MLQAAKLIAKTLREMGANFEEIPKDPEGGIHREFEIFGVSNPDIHPEDDWVDAFDEPIAVLELQDRSVYFMYRQNKPPGVMGWSQSAIDLDADDIKDGVNILLGRYKE